MSGWRLYFRYVSLSIQSQLQYRASVIMMAIAHFMVTFVELLAIWFLFESFGHLRGWSFEEVALFYGIVSVSFAISEGAARGFDTFHRQVKSGDFDRMLLRPRSAASQVIGHEFQIYRLGRFTQGFLVLVWAAYSLGVAWTISKVLLLITAVIGGGFMFSGLFVLQATLSFWSIESLDIARMVTDGGVETAQFPITIYQEWFRNIFVYIIPLACINYFPAMGILDRADPLGAPNWFYWVSPLVGVLFFAVCLKVWNIGIRYYRSTGS